MTYSESSLVVETLEIFCLFLIFYNKHVKLYKRNFKDAIYKHNVKNNLKYFILSL